MAIGASAGSQYARGLLVPIPVSKFKGSTHPGLASGSSSAPADVPEAAPAPAAPVVPFFPEPIATEPAASGGVPTIAYVAGGVLVLGVIAFVVLRKRR
jgi:hypothetical protein